MITVLCATLNRAASLGRVLDAYTRLSALQGGWQLVLVDNGSQDETPELARRFSERLPIHYFFEPCRGKSYALNTGLEHVSGDLIVFTDDDALPEPNWLLAYRHAADTEPACDLFTGPIQLLWPYPPPSWAVCDEFLSGGCFVSSPRELPDGITGQYPLGANFGVRKLVLDAGYRFNVALGPGLAPGQDIDLLRRLKKAGHKTWWTNAAAVRHIVREEELKQDWVLRRGFRLGRGHYREGLLEDGPPALLCGFPRWALRASVTQLLRVVWSKAFASPDQFFVARWYLHYYCGHLYEAHRMHAEIPG